MEFFNTNLNEFSLEKLFSNKESLAKFGKTLFKKIFESNSRKSK